MEQSRDTPVVDQSVDVRPEDHLTFFNWGSKFPLTPLPGIDGTKAWEFMWDTSEIRDLIK